MFRPRMHDTGEKVVLGVHIPPRGGLQDGEVVLDLLSRHPSTARFIATKLVRRFVADLPPPALVDRAARAFLDTDGDIRAVVRTIITSPEFFSEAAYIAKTKSPLQFVASAVRVVGGEAHSRSSLPAVVGQLGEPLFQAMPPTGYPDTAEAWVNAGSLIGRMDFALALAGSHVSGTWVDLDRLIGSVDRRHPQMVLDRLLSLLLHQDISPETRQALGRQLDAPEMNPRISVGQGNTDAVVLAALILGSPDFQRW